MKKCKQCECNRDVSEYYVYKDGSLYTICKPCKRNITHLHRKTDKYKSTHRDYVKNYMRSFRENENERVANVLRKRLSDFVRGKNKNGSSIKDLGCTIEELKMYLEKQFKPGMTWDNRGFTGWHIDHIKPLSKFDLSNRDELLKAVNYTNLQPLWASENIAKGNR